MKNFRRRENARNTTAWFMKSRLPPFPQYQMSSLPNKVQNYFVSITIKLRVRVYMHKYRSK